MDEATAKILAKKASEIAKDTAEKLKFFTKETATLLYAKQMIDSDLNVKANFTEETEHKKMDSKEANQKLNKMMEEAKLKWKYADDIAKKRVVQMEKIVLEGQANIKAIYAEEIAKLMPQTA